MPPPVELEAWHLESTAPNEWRMWDHERKWKPDAAEFTIETPRSRQHELDLYIGEAARQTLYSEGLLDPVDR